MATAEQRASLYRQHNKVTRCACEKHCQAFRRDHPRLAATEDGTIEIAHRSKQYRSGDLT